MTQQDYEQNKRECWEEFCIKNPAFNDMLGRKIFNQIYDRAYALGKQTETITQEDIEKLAKEFAERECEIGQVDRDALYKGYYHGMKDSLGKQEKDAENTVISGWVARDDGERWHERELHLFTRNKPERRKLMGDWIGRPSMTLDSNLFPDLTWKSDPIEVQLIIKRKKK